MYYDELDTELSDKGYANVRAGIFDVSVVKLGPADGYDAWYLMSVGIREADRGFSHYKYNSLDNLFNHIADIAA